MSRFCLFAYTGLTDSDRFRRARGFLYNLASLLKLIRSEKNNVLILEKFLYDDEQTQFSKQKCGKCSKQMNEKGKKNPKIPLIDVIGGRFKV